MTKKIEIELERGGKFIAELLEDAAPETCKVMWNSLPLERTVKHAMLSGQIFSAKVDFVLRAVENAKCHFEPGEMGFTTHNIPGGFLGPVNRPEPCDFNFAYGPVNMLVDIIGIPCYPNHWATIVEGDLKKLLEIGNRIREKGVEKVTLKKK